MFASKIQSRAGHISHKWFLFIILNNRSINAPYIILLHESKALSHRMKVNTDDCINREVVSLQKEKARQRRKSFLIAELFTSANLEYPLLGDLIIRSRESSNLRHTCTSQDSHMTRRRARERTCKVTC